MSAAVPVHTPLEESAFVVSTQRERHKDTGNTPESAHSGDSTASGESSKMKRAWHSHQPL